MLIKITATLHGKCNGMKIAVECLESKSDDRYKYFSSKIQQLMKRKLILEEMNTKAIKKLDPELLL